MKKIVGILLVVATLFSIVGCSKTEAKKAEKQVLDVIISQYGNYTKEWWTEFEKNFEAANDIKIPYVIKERRPGDIATCYCDPGKAERELGWKAQYGIREMCADSWRWQKNNPNGYED